MDAPFDAAQDRPLRLTPTMVSRKLLVLDFIKRYYGRWGASPSMDEIAAALEVSKQRVDKLLRQLEADGFIGRERGQRRGIKLADKAQELSEADALLRLRDFGWKVDVDVLTGGPLQEPLRHGSGQALTKRGLPELPRLYHNPSPDIGVGTSSGNQE